MNILDLLYALIIGPIKMLFEVVFSLAYTVSGSPGLSIIALSLVMNIILLPLYNTADRIQKEENDLQLKFKPYVDHIKKVFKGDEQYMILSTYYRQNNYKPIYALRSSISLLLQIPFFIAAYDFLSNLNLLHNASFFLINDLGVQDGLLNGINLLPILMTIVNIVSSLIYLKGQSLKNNLQLFIMALFFLFFLYDRPSGLVLYWTLNNVFSLVKNIYVELRKKFSRKQEKTEKSRFDLNRLISYLEIDDKTFMLACICLTVIIGLYIPSALIKSSPAEFIDTASLKKPVWYIINCLAISAGLFVIWLNVFYKLSGSLFRKILAFAVTAFAFIALIDYLFFGTDLGVLSNTLVFENDLIFSGKELIINLLAVLLVIAAVCVFRKRLYTVLLIVLISTMALSVFNIYQLNSEADKAMATIAQSKEKIDQFEIALSKDSNNIVVIMLDRAISSYFPYCLAERPELQEKFSGFTYYPNTVSYGESTNFCAPSLFGGYEYTPEEINKRTEESLKDKQNEALKVLPVMFDEKGYDVTVCDLPLANYDWITDLSIFDEYKDIKTYITKGQFTLEGFEDYKSLDCLNHKLFLYSFMKSSPLAIQSKIYNSGYYHDVDLREKGESITSEFYDSFSVLTNFTQRTKVYDKTSGSLFMLENDTTHSPAVLKEPEYYPSVNTDNEEYDKEHYIRTSIYGGELSLETADQYRHYMVNMAALVQLGEWFDYLKSEGVYDNTRIIIAGDHGRSLNQFSELLFDYGTKDIMQYNPLLLFKDFDQKDLTIDYSLMTHADVPLMATKDVIESPVNPFTGKVLSDDTKTKSEELHIFMSEAFDVTENNGNVFIEGPWCGVRDNILDKNNWREIEDPNK